MHYAYFSSLSPEYILLSVTYLSILAGKRNGESGKGLCLKCQNDFGFYLPEPLILHDCRSPFLLLTCPEPAREVC